MAFKRKSKEEKAMEKELQSRELNFSDYPYLLACKPKEKYVFYGDYFTIDGQYAAILSFFHTEGANDGFPSFWGIGRIPMGLDKDITSICFEQIRRMPKGWVESHESTAESVNTMNNQEVNSSKSTKAMKLKNNKKSIELEEIARELSDNAAYLQCHFKVMLKAPTLEALDLAITQIGRRYTDVFGSLEAAPFAGEQRQELSTLFSINAKKRGHPFYFTSTEFAGDYNLVTHGIEDPNGEYVGKMFGDVNNSAVLFAVDEYPHHVVIANENYSNDAVRTPMADFWGSKISQSCMIHNGRVVHIILDGCKLDMIGPKFKKITYKLDMNTGDVNMFEMFGKHGEEETVFANQMQKLILMAEQAYETTESDRSIIRGSLEEIATRFYKNRRMWYDDAKKNRQKLRVIGIPHKSVPILSEFVPYLDEAYKAETASGNRDDEKIHALGVLKATFHNLLGSNGDLFDGHTTDAIDGCRQGRRVVYDFSQLRKRGEGVAMAQLVNVIGFAVGNLGKGDTVIFHGADKIADRVKQYITDQLDMLYDKGGRVVFLYNNIDKMMYDKAFSHYDKADYTIIGSMTPTQVQDYKKSLGQDIPADLVNLVTVKGNNNLCYLRRNGVNVVFEQDLLLGLSGKGAGA